MEIRNLRVCLFLFSGTYKGIYLHKMFHACMAWRYHHVPTESPLRYPSLAVCHGWDYRMHQGDISILLPGTCLLSNRDKIESEGTVCVVVSRGQRWARAIIG